MGARAEFSRPDTSPQPVTPSDVSPIRPDIARASTWSSHCPPSTWRLHTVSGGAAAGRGSLDGEHGDCTSGSAAIA